MYTIREDSTKKLLSVDAAGQMTTEEALRALSQAFTLAEASHIHAITCDITRLTKGPAGLMVLAASMAVRHRPGMRLALVADDRQMRVVARVVAYSGLKEGLKAFESGADAEVWLRPALAPAAAGLAETAWRHVESMMGAPSAAPAQPQRSRSVAGGASPAA